MGIKGRTVFVAACCLFFSAAKIALSAESTPASSTAVRDLKVSDIFVPQDLGYVLETHEPANPSGAPIIVQIQEAHVNYEGQKHLADILERLIKEHGLKLILVEGGQGDASLAYLRDYGSAERRKQVAEKYLKAGIMSGEEYLDMTSNYPLILWGVEESGLYRDNVEAFLAAESLQASFNPVLTGVQEAVEKLKPALSDPALMELDTKAKAFDRHELSLADYAQTLERIATDHAVTLETHPNLQRFLHVRQLEQSIALPKVQEEQQALLAALSEHVAEAQLEALVTKATGMKEGTVKPIEFYEALAQLAQQAQINLETYPTLSAYTQYLSEKAQISTTHLAQELDTFPPILREHLTATPESRQLNAISEEADLINKLLNFQLSPEEYRRLELVETATIASRWPAFLDEQLKQHGLPSVSSEGLQELSTKIPELQRFYRVAAQRDEQLVKHAIEKLHETHESLAVLITGGFHASTITNKLTEHGVATVVVTPKVSQPTDERLYRAVMKYKSGHGSLEDVLAISNQQAINGR